MTTQTGGPAFPMPMTMMTAEHIANEPEYGMTLRDYFAAKVLQGLCAGLKSGDRVDHIPTFAYQLADSMLKAREA